MCNALGGVSNLPNPLRPTRFLGDAGSFDQTTYARKGLYVTAGGGYALSLTRTLSCVHPLSQLILFSSAVWVCVIAACVRPYRKSCAAPCRGCRAMGWVWMSSYGMLPPQTSKSSTGGRPVTGSICRWTHHCPDVAARSARLSPSREICKLTVWGRPSRVLALSCHWLDRSDQSINQSTNRCVTLDSTTILFSQSATGRPAVTLFLLLRWDECFCPEVELAGIGESGPGSICRLTRGHSVAACGFGELPAGRLSSTCWSQSATRKADVAHTIIQSGRLSCPDVELAGVGKLGPGSICRTTLCHAVAACDSSELPGGITARVAPSTQKILFAIRQAGARVAPSAQKSCCHSANRCACSAIYTEILFTIQRTGACAALSAQIQCCMKSSMTARRRNRRRQVRKAPGRGSPLSTPLRPTRLPSSAGSPS